MSKEIIEVCTELDLNWNRNGKGVVRLELLQDYLDNARGNGATHMIFDVYGEIENGEVLIDELYTTGAIIK